MKIIKIAIIKIISQLFAYFVEISDKLLFKNNVICKK